MFRREGSRSDVFALEIAKKHLSLLYKSSLHFTNILFRCFIVRSVLFPEEIDRDYSQLPVIQPLGCSGCCTVTCRWVCARCLWGCHKWSCKGMISVKWGEIMVVHTFSRFSGAYPPNMTLWSKGGIPRTPRAPRFRWPQQRARKKKWCTCSSRAAGTLITRQN